MSKPLFRLSRALNQGRVAKGVPASREALLVGLLRKRAAAHIAGLTEQERMLRNQIGWALPMRHPGDDPSEHVERLAPAPFADD